MVELKTAIGGFIVYMIYFKKLIISVFSNEPVKSKIIEYKKTESILNKTIYITSQVIAIKEIKKFEIKAAENAENNGTAISENSFKVAPLTFISRFTFKKQVRKFEKYIIPIKPNKPNRGSKIKISIILMEESNIAVRKEKTCWSRPFKIPSEILSKYIKGIMGDNACNKKPTSASL